MKLIVFGASGPTGLHIVNQALDAGHSVVAPTRRPDAFPIDSPSVEPVQADVTSPSDVRSVVTSDADAVVSTFGVPYGRQRITTYSEGAVALVLAMREAGVDRLVTVSSATVDDRPTPGQPWWYDAVLHRLLRGVVGRTLYDDMERMEAVVRSSGLAWTIVRPAGLYEADDPSDWTLTAGRAEGRYTSRADLAAALLELATTDHHVGEVVEVVSARGPEHPIKNILAEAFG